MTGEADTETEDRCPPTIWSRIREGLLLDALLLGLVFVAAGLIVGSRDLVTGGLVVASAAVLAHIPVLFLEYRADMKHKEQLDESEEQE
jgi:hypothetical protein